MTTSAYAITVTQLEATYDRTVESCRRQAIRKIGICASMTGKLMGELEQMTRMRRRLELDGIDVFGMVYPIGHPAMGATYGGRTEPPDPLPFYAGGGVESEWRAAARLPVGWHYAVNEFGFPVFNCACPDDACVAGNARVTRLVARVFDEVWLDDDFRVDGDQGAGTPTGSTASCYCERCLSDLAARLGRPVRREDVVSDAALHEAWTERKVDRLALLWSSVCRAGRSVNAALKLGIMVRWGGEERDGIAIPRLLPGFGNDVRVRAGEGHFGPDEYGAPEGPAQSYLSVSHHVGWLPRSVEVLSETTYFAGVRHEDLRKKIALALAAGAREISYCPCVGDWIVHQDFLEGDLAEIRRWGEAFGERGRLVNPVVILRTPSAGRGASDPVARTRDRRIFPWFTLAGIGAVVTRVPAARPAGVRVVAVTGRAALDVPDDWLDGVTVVLDGAALLEASPLQARLGISSVTRGEGGRVDFEPLAGWLSDGLLFSRPGWVVVPYVWQDVPAANRNAILGDLRRVVGPLTGAPTLTGDFDVFLAAADAPVGRVVMLVNLTREPRRVSVRLLADEDARGTADGTQAPTELTLEPDAIRLLRGPG